MSWWSSVVDGVKSIGTKIGDGIKWTWNNASLSKIISSTVTYTANTAVGVLEQGLALRKAVPTLLNKASAQNIVYGMGYIAVKMTPILALNYGVNRADNYFREGYETDAWYDPYSIFLGGLSIANYAVIAYTFRQGAETITQVSVLNAVAPSAFNSNKTLSAPVVRNDSKPTIGQQTKGVFQEPLILAANDLGTSLVSYLPGGRFVAPILRICFNGRYITRSVTPERSVNNKQIQSESALALGLTYEASTMLMDYLLEASVGMPPFLYYKTLKYLVLLLHINVAAHMDLPLAKESTLIIDPFSVYERVNRFFLDVIFAGLKDRIPKDFKPEKGVPPLIPLSPLLKAGTLLLNSGQESETHVEPGLLIKSLSTARAWLAPPIFQPNGFNTDPIMSMYWPGIHEGSLSAVSTILSFRESKTKTALHWVPPSGVAKIINLKFGIPKGIVKLLIMLSKEEDFWDFLEALQFFLMRNKAAQIVAVNEASDLALFGEKERISLPSSVDEDVKPIHHATQLITTRLRSLPSIEQDREHSALILDDDARIQSSSERQGSDSESRQEPVVKASELISVKERKDVNPVSTAASLFSTRQRNKGVEVSNSSALVSTRVRETNNTSTETSLFY